MSYSILQVMNSNGVCLFRDKVLSLELAIKRINWLAGEKPNTRFVAKDSEGNKVAEAIVYKN